MVIVGTLYVVGTPIGNLEDISLRALRVLKEVGLLAAEDTRRTRMLLARYDIHTPLTSYFEHNKLKKLEWLMGQLAEKDVALVSEAGMPGLSDPGYELIREALAQEIEVVPVPGPSALTTALAISGLPTDQFLYLGFLPRRAKARRELLQAIAGERRTLAAFEAPHRLLAALQDLQELLGNRRMALARELTKMHEEVLRGTVEELRARLGENPPRGEFTLVIAGAPERVWSDEEMRQALAELREKEVPGREAVARAVEISGRPRREVYRLLLEMRKKEAEMNLDAEELYRRLDAGDMLRCIAELPKQCERAWQEVRAWQPPAAYREVEQVVIAGMGGSAISGDLVRSFAERECAIPIAVVRDYSLPAYVDERTLVIASSYSGNTEETLSAFREALARGAKLIVLTTGGELAARARESGIPLLAFSYPAQPRAALGYSFIYTLGILERLGLIGDPSAALGEALQEMEALQKEIGREVPTAHNPAKGLAQELQGKLLLVYGAEHLQEVARRWKGQFNENAKTWSAFEFLPELNHNAIVGSEFPQDLANRIAILLLDSALYNPRTRLRIRLTQEILAERGASCHCHEARGRGRLAQMLTTIHFGDFVSYYSALLNGLDPSPVAVIDRLKRELARA